MAREPLVSVVIPVHDGERYLGEAIESVLAQTHRAHEVIVVDDGSTDGSREVAEGYAPACRCVSQPQSGTAAARNAGVGLARGDYIAFLDADDLWEPRKLELQLAAFAADPAPDVVYCLMRHFVSPDLDAETKGRFRPLSGLQRGFVAGAVMISRAGFDRVGPFDAGLTQGEGFEWIARARERGLREHVIERKLLSRRIHGTNKMVQKERVGDFARIIKASLDRRRAAGGVTPAEGGTEC